MNEMFSQGGKGSTGILTNKQAIARHFGVKQSEVQYFSPGVLLSGYRVLYDKTTQRAYSLPANIADGTTATSLTESAVLTHSAGTIDLGALAQSRGEYFVLPGSFVTGSNVLTYNDLLTYNSTQYRWDGALPKQVPSGSSPETTGGIGEGKWVSRTNSISRTEAETLFVSKRFVPASGSFQVSGTALSNKSALYDSVTGMYYTPKSGEVTVPAGSAPDSSWVCVGKFQYEPIGDLRNFGGVVTTDTSETGAKNAAAFVLASRYSEFSKEPMVFPDGQVFNSDYVTLTDVNFLDIRGTGTFRARSNRTGVVDYSGGAMLTLIRCSNVTIAGPLFDGNRSGSPQYTGFAHGVQFTTATGDFRSVTTRLNKNIKILAPTKFKNLGSYRAGDDKFGDGIYLFGVEKFAIQGIEFTDMGRWGIALSDSNDGDISKCLCTNTMANSVALGFLDIETESTDPVNGTSAYNIDVHDNRMIGFGQILVGAGNNTENKAGLNHFIRNIRVYRNYLTVPADITHAIANYDDNLVYIGMAPFCHDYSSTRLVTNEKIFFYDNIIENFKPNNKSIGYGINAQGTGSGSSLFNVVKDILFDNNLATGFYKPFQGAGTSNSTGYTFKRVVVSRNTLRASDVSGTIGLRLAATQLVDCELYENYVEGTSMRAVSIEDGRDIGAIDSRVTFRNNTLRAKSGSNMFAYCYRMVLQGNTVYGDATALDSTISVIEKDSGNTWNTFTRTLPSTGTLANGAQFIASKIDLGSQVRFGYSLRVCPPFEMGGLQVTGNITGAGIGEAIFSNLSGAAVGRTSDIYTLIAEKA